MRGGGSKAVWNFPKNSSNLVAGSFPRRQSSDLCQCVRIGPSPSSLLLFNKFRNGEVCEWCFSPSKEIFFSSDIRIYIADFKITRICLVNSLYFSFTVDKKLFAYNLSADHQGVFSSEPSSPPLHISTGHHQHSSIEAEIAPQCRSIHAATTPKPTITFKLKHFSTVYLIAHTPQ